MSASPSLAPAAGWQARRLPFGLLAIGLVLLVAVLPYAAGYGNFRKSLFNILWDGWFDPRDSTWQHGALAPVIAGWLAWRRRHELAALPLRPAMSGLLLMVLALFSYFAGYKANNFYFGALAIQLLVAGAVAWTMSWRHFRVLIFAWCMLAFTWPVRFLEDTLGFQLRLVMVRSVSAVLELVHAPILRDGTSLISAPGPGHAAGSWLTLNVDGPCSGMRSLFALMMVSALFAWFRQPSLLRRAALFATSIPLAVLGNMVRIFILIGGSALFGQGVAVGNAATEMTTFHMLAGIAVFVVAVFGLQGVSALMDRLLPRTKSSEAPAIATLPVASASASMVAFALALLTALGCWFSPAMKGGEDAGVVMRLPQRVGPLVGAPGKPDKVELENLPGDTEFAKMTYYTAGAKADERDVAHVSIVLAGAERRSIHRPEVCLVGQGWNIVGSEVMPVEVAPGHPLNVKDLTIEKLIRDKAGREQRLRAHYVYWFVGADITTPSHFERIWRSTWDSVLRNVNHRWAYPSVMATVTDNLDPADSQERHRTDEQTKRLITFLIQKLAPQFQKDCMPHPLARS